MKYFVPLLLIVLNVHLSLAQDQIIMKSAEEIKGKVTENKIDRIVYKDFDNLEGPSIELRKGDVFMIIYENGKTYKVEESSKYENPANSSQATSSNSKLDSLVHHIIGFSTNLPEVRTGGGSELIGAGIGISYEFQSRKKIFGLRVSPIFSLRDFGIDQWAFNFLMSPRWYLVNKAPGQFFIGIEGGVGTMFKPDNWSNQGGQSYSSIMASAHWILGSHLFTNSGFNTGIEAGFGYQYTKIESVYVWFSNSNSTLSESNMFSFFLRLNIGGRLKGKQG